MRGIPYQHYLQGQRDCRDLRPGACWPQPQRQVLQFCQLPCGITPSALCSPGHAAAPAGRCQGHGGRLRGAHPGQGKPSLLGRQPNTSKGLKPETHSESSCLEFWGWFCFGCGGFCWFWGGGGVPQKGWQPKAFTLEPCYWGID